MGYNPNPNPNWHSDYGVRIEDQFRDLEINLVRHDDSPTGLPCYIEVHLGKAAPKDKGTLVLDLGNYIYRRFGLRYRMTPEFRGKGKATTLRWFMSWDDIRPILSNIWQAVLGKEASGEHRILPVSFRSLIIQNSKRGVCPSNQE
jgi:hypothetical protein